jgi:uncharacterized protein with PQ loop repeat
MTILELSYTLAAIVALSACIPQMRQLISTKQSDELSLWAWCLWTLTQIVTLLYVASIGNVLMISVNLAWVSFYGVMTILIVRYRPVAVANEVEATPIVKP